MAKKIKVSGYSRQTKYNDNIEYRNFSPDLVGLEFANKGGTPLFTMGNFSITTNLDPKIDKTYVTGKFSEFFTLDKLDLTVEDSVKLIKDNASVFLNLDETNLKNYALFGSMTEYFRTTLEEIIMKWPASLYVTPSAFYDNQFINGFTYENYVYDYISDEATFKLNTTLINNKFGINYLQSGSLANTFNQTNDLRNLTINYSSYAILISGKEYDILEFTGSTYEQADYVYFKVKGDVFSGATTGAYLFYHIKPKKVISNLFFNTLTGLHEYLLNRQILPLYTAIFKYPIRTDSGILLYASKSLTWPVTDGYNIDFDTTEYENYAQQLFDLATNYDLNETGLMTRFLVSESISEFDTVPVILAEVHQDTTTGQKVNKTLNIYGRSFDDINQFITGIAFAHTVTYNKQDNVPDVYLKDLARVFGWELISSAIETNLLKNYTEPEVSDFEGLPVGLTSAQADIELWRRLILNSPWIWKSKGARKSIEFLLNFIGTPYGLVTFNEYVYRAKEPIDVDLFLQVLALNDLDPDLSLYPIDANGYPKPFRNTSDMYFQNNGLWYRETGGTGSTIDIRSGNNPHVGPYDGGFKYINQFRSLIPNFSAVTVTLSEPQTSEKNIFLNYALGDITNYEGDTYVDVTALDGSDLGGCVVYKADIIADPMPKDVLTPCGCPCEGEDDSLSICVEKGSNEIKPCSNLLKEPGYDSATGLFVFTKYFTNNQTTQTAYIDRECCSYLGGNSTYADSKYLEYFPSSPTRLSSGYVCCKSEKCGCNITANWVIDKVPTYIPQGTQNAYLIFKTLYGSNVGRTTTIVPDASACPQYTTPTPNITDPYTGEVGVGCKLTQILINDPYSYQQLYEYYQYKVKNLTSNNQVQIITTSGTIIRVYGVCEFTFETYLKNIPQLRGK